MSSFLTFLAAPAVRQASEKSIFGRPHIRVGRLFGVLGYWVYQVGGVLGYALRDRPALLTKLAAPPGAVNIDETQVIQGIRESAAIVESELKEMEGKQKTFFHLYTVRELERIGINVLRWPPDKSLDKKADSNLAGDVMRISFIRGIDLGFNFPVQFSTYWDNTYRAIPGDEWERMHQRGIVASKTQNKLTLNEAIMTTAEGAITWSTGQSPHPLHPDDIRVLRGLIAVNEKL